MRYSRFLTILASFLGAYGQGGHAQAPTIPVRPLGATLATTTEPIGNNNSVRPLNNGRVLVNDLAKRRLILFDSTLQHVVVIADTTSATSKAYGAGLTGMIPFVGDSSLILDEAAKAFVIIDPAGKIARIMPMPMTTLTTTVGNSFMSGPLGAPLGFDQAGHLLFRSTPPPFGFAIDQGFVGDTLVAGPDSIAIFRVNLTSRRLDTIAMLQAPKTRQALTRRGPGLGGSGRSAFNPIPSSDDWTLLNDGTVAIVRVRDYHIDWIQPDGHTTSGPKIPARWVRITDSMKVAMMDSLSASDSIAYAARIAAIPQAKRDSMAQDSLDRLAAAAAGVRRPGGLISLGSGPRRAFVAPSDLPDYWPPFATGFAQADADGNIWVREQAPHAPAPVAGRAMGGSVPVYDVINRRGDLIDRVQIPAGKTLVGFGPGVVYLTSRAGLTVQIARVSIH